MKLGRALRPGVDGPEPRLVAVAPDEGVAVDLATAERARLELSGATAASARRLADALFPGSTTAALGAGAAFRDAAERAAEHGRRRGDGVVPLDDMRLIAPVDPPVMLDASAFEQHLVNAHARGKREVPEYFYRVPTYYKMNPVTVFGPDDEVPWPGDVGFMDYELEFALVIGATGSDLRPDEVPGHIFGITVMNDFSGRDVQAREMASGFGPVKGKDFATAIGPWITTLDEVEINDLDMVARVNGDEWSRGSTSTLTWSVEEIVAFASSGEMVVPGEVIGSGTVGLGSGLELFRKLEPGDVVELEVADVGVLRNRVGHPSTVRWHPDVKERRAQVTLPARDVAPS